MRLRSDSEMCCFLPSAQFDSIQSDTRDTTSERAGRTIDAAMALQFNSTLMTDCKREMRWVVLRSVGLPLLSSTRPRAALLFLRQINHFSLVSVRFLMTRHKEGRKPSFFSANFTRHHKRMATVDCRLHGTNLNKICKDANTRRAGI